MKRGGIALLVLLLGGCPGSGAQEAEGGGTAGDEDVMFPDEAAARTEDVDAPPASPAVAEAEGLLVEGKGAEAQVVLEAAIAEAPEDLRAHLDLGLAFELQGQPGPAEAAYRRALEIEPAFPEALNNLGLLLREQGRQDEAVEVLRRAIAARRDFASAHVNLALALEEAGRLPEALEVYRAAVQIAPRDPMTRVNFGLALIAAGDEANAAIELRRGLNVGRGNAAALSAAGSGLRRVGEADAAVRALSLAIEAHGEPTAALLSELALAQRAAGDRSAARATLSQAIDLDPEYAPTHYLLGNMLAGDGSYAEAVTHYRRYLALEPNGPLADRVRDRIRAARRAQ
ncbi:MAG: tetratricopeptide repeat protein [Deltaproteobacteria bacterium]|nr:tetratricopeptide repeat protein [Deltaproteobacteria bacterium]